MVAKRNTTTTRYSRSRIGAAEELRRFAAYRPAVSTSLSLATSTGTCSVCKATDRPLWVYAGTARCANCCARTCCAVEPLGAIEFGIESDPRRFLGFSRTTQRTNKKGHTPMKTIKFNEYETLKRGVYPAIVESINDDEGQYGPQLKFIFRITSGKYLDKKVFAWASPVLTPKSKLTTWMAAIAPKAVLGPGFELDPADLVDREVQLVLGLKPGNDGIERNVIESLLPIEDEEEAAEEAPAAREPVAAAPARKPAPF